MFLIIILAAELLYENIPSPTNNVCIYLVIYTSVHMTCSIFYGKIKIVTICIKHIFINQNNHHFSAKRQYGFRRKMSTVNVTD